MAVLPPGLSFRFGHDPGDSLAYGQIRESPNGRKFLMLAPVPTDTWMWSTVVLTGHDTNSIGPVWRMSATWLAKWPLVGEP